MRSVFFFSGEYFSQVRLCSRDCHDMLERNGFGLRGEIRSSPGNSVTMAGAPAVDCDWLLRVNCLLLMGESCQLGLI